MYSLQSIASDLVLMQDPHSKQSCATYHIDYNIFFAKILKEDIVDKLVNDKEFVKVLDNIISYINH